MSAADPDDRPDELTKRYRAASAMDPARPSDAVREAVLAHARALAREASPATDAAPARRAMVNDARWRMSIAATVIVAGLATVLAWQAHTPTRVAQPVPAAPPAVAPDHTAAASKPAGESSPVEGVGSPPVAEARVRGTAGHAGQEQRNVAPAAADISAGNTTKGVAGLRSNSVAAPAPAAPARGAGSARAEDQSLLRSATESRAASSAAPALVMAAASGNIERVEQLLRSGVSTEETDARGRTALLVATLHGDLPMVRMLLAAGARADAADEDGDTPLAAARRQGSPELEGLLERANQP